MDHETFLYCVLWLCVIASIIFVRFLVNYYLELAVLKTLRLQVLHRMHEIKIEVHGDSMFWYDKDTDQFFAQGKTMQECVEIVKQMWANEIFVITTKDARYLLMGPEFEFEQVNFSKGNEK